jgi:predicted Zn-dependent peptidase
MKIKTNSIHELKGLGPIWKKTYPNGAVSFYHQFKGLKRCHVLLGYCVGSYLEKENEHGLAHVMEHLFFRYAKNHPSGDLVEKLENLGAEINAYTAHDMMAFELTGPEQNIKACLDLFLAMFKDFKVSELDFNKEKKVILQELREDYSNQDMLVEENLFERYFGTQYGHAIGGKLKDVKNLSYKQVLSFYKRNFCAPKVCLVIIAPKAFEHIDSLVNDFFSSQKRKSLPYRLFNQKFKLAPVKHVKKDIDAKGNNSFIILAFKAPKLDDPKRSTMLLLDQILCEGMSSLLFTRLRVDKAMIYAHTSSINTFLWGGQYTITIYAKKDKLKTIEQIVIKTFKEIADAGINDELIKNACRKLTYSYQMSLDELETRADYILRSEFFTGNFDSLTKLEQNLNEVTSKSLAEFTAMLLKNDYSVIRAG